MSLAMAWLFLESLDVRFEIRSLFKAAGFGLLGITGFLMLIAEQNIDLNYLWMILPTSISLYAIFLGFIFDGHAKFSFGIILMVFSFYFVRNTLLLSIQSGLVALVVLQLAYTTRHRDFIPLGVGFVLMSVAEFLKSQGTEYSPGAPLIYLFVTLFFGIWLWQYISPRLQIRSSLRFHSGNNQ